MGWRKWQKGRRDRGLCSLPLRIFWEGYSPLPHIFAVTVESRIAKCNEKVLTLHVTVRTDCCYRAIRSLCVTKYSGDVPSEAFTSKKRRPHRLISAIAFSISLGVNNDLSLKRFHRHCNQLKTLHNRISCLHTQTFPTLRLSRSKSATPSQSDFRHRPLPHQPSLCK